MTASSNDSGAEFPPVVALVGPTAAGKSALAVDLARALGAEIVTADSRQVYRYMNVGTAKPTLAEQGGVPHHMLDLVAPDESYSAQRFASEGEAVLRAIASRKRVALVAGGTGFYIRALLDRPVFPSVPPSPALRARWQAMAQHEGPEAVHRLLAARDPRSAERLHPHNLARVVRALEIVEAMGSVPPAESGNAIPALYLGLTAERHMLHARIEVRVEEQMESGLLEETRDLLAMGYDPDSGPLSGFGYREMVALLRGDLSRSGAVERYATATRQYARRQYTWFRADERIQWLSVEEDPLKTAVRLSETWLAGPPSTAPSAPTVAP